MTRHNVPEESGEKTLRSSATAREVAAAMVASAGCWAWDPEMLSYWSSTGRPRDCPCSRVWWAGKLVLLIHATNSSESVCGDGMHLGGEALRLYVLADKHGKRFSRPYSVLSGPVLARAGFSRPLLHLQCLLISHSTEAVQNTEWINFFKCGRCG